MKKLITSSILLASAFTLNAAPFVTVGDQLDLYLTSSLVGKWNSNITYSNDNKLNDYSMLFRIGAEADYGKNSKFKANVKFYEDFNRYLDYHEFNSTLANVEMTAAYVDDKFSVKSNFSFNERYQNTSDTIEANALGDLVRSNAWAAGLNGTYDVTAKVFAELGFNWNQTQYVGRWANSYSDQNVYTIPVSLLYRVTEKVSAGLSYQYRYTTFSGGSALSAAEYGDDRQDHFIGLSLRGDVLPKLNLSAYAGIGYRYESSPLLGDNGETTFALNATATYSVSEKINVYGMIKRDFGSGSSRQSTINTGGEIGANYAFSQYVSLVGALSYVNTEYEAINRVDDNIGARVGINYKPNRYLTLGANYNYLNNNSSSVYATYNQHLISLSAAIRY